MKRTLLYAAALSVPLAAAYAQTTPQPQTPPAAGGQSQGATTPAPAAPGGTAPAAPAAPETAPAAPDTAPAASAPPAADAPAAGSPPPAGGETAGAPATNGAPAAEAAPGSADTAPGAAEPPAEPAETAAAAPKVEIAPEQRTVIRETIVQQDVEPVVDIDFEINVGRSIPRTVVLHPLPPRIIEIVPAYADYQYFILADGTIVIVEPSTYAIVYVIAA